MILCTSAIVADTLPTVDPENAGSSSECPDRYSVVSRREIQQGELPARWRQLASPLIHEIESRGVETNDHQANPLDFQWSELIEKHEAKKVQTNFQLRTLIVRGVQPLNRDCVYTGESMQQNGLVLDFT